jgi:hypothetical protein
MATTTDLPGFLRNDDDNLELRLTEWVSGLSSEDLPGSIRIHWKPTGLLSEEPLNEVAVTSLPVSAAMLVEEVRKKVTDKLGPQPEGGTLRVRASRRSQKASPDVDMSRKLVAGAVEGDVNAALYKGEADRLRLENQELRRQYGELAKSVVAMGGSMTALVGKQAETIGTLGTVRATAGAADEFGGLKTAIGMYLLLQFLPVIKEQLGLNRNASLREVMDAGGRLMRGELDTQAKAPAPPPGAGHGPAPRQINGPAGKAIDVDTAPASSDAGAPALTIKEQVEAIIERFRTDQEFRRVLALRLAGDTELQEELRGAAMAALMEGVSQ